MADIIVNAGGNLQAALDSSVGGDRILTEAGATFEGNFTLPGKSSYTTLLSNTTIPSESTRISAATAVNFTKIVAPSGGSAAVLALPGSTFWNITGVKFLFNPGGFHEVISLGDGDRNSQTTLAQCPRFMILDRIYMDSSSGLTTQKRGVGLNCRDVQVKNSYFAGIKAPSQDSQAVAAFNGPGPFYIYNNYLEAASENLLFGGSDSASLALMPQNATVINNYMTKNLALRGVSGWNVKNLFEIKAGINMNINANIFENCWGDAQAGSIIVITVRNQDGDAIWSEIRNVTFTNNIVRHGGGGFNFSGRDVRSDGTVVPTQGMTGVTVRDNVFYDISDSWSEPGAPVSARWIQLNNGGNNFVFDHNTCLNTQNGQAVSIYFSDGNVNGFTLTNNIFNDNGLAIFGDQGHNPGTDTLAAQAPGYVYNKNVLIGGAFPSLYPAGSYFPAAIADVGFTNVAVDNYQLLTSSPYHNASTTGDDIGARFGTVVTPPPPVEPPVTPPPPPPPDPPPPPVTHPPGSFTGSAGLYQIVSGRKNDQIYVDSTTDTKIVKKIPNPEASFYLSGDQ